MDDDGGSSVSQFGSSNERASADEMDEKRRSDVGYGYLCRLEEAKLWIESCINEQLPPTTELEEGLRNGVYLAKLGNFFCPKAVPLKKLYDINQSRYKAKGLHFRHTDNINYWIKAMAQIGLPQLVFPETTDVYEKKNIPKVIYCLHALSLFLHNSGKAPKIQDLYGKAKFTEEEISAVNDELQKCGIEMPAFNTVAGIVTKDMPTDEAAMHEGVFAINQVIDSNVTDDLREALMNPSVLLFDIDTDNIKDYQEQLLASKILKTEKYKIEDNESPLTSAYSKLLTKEEIQEGIFVVNYKTAFINIRVALSEGNREMLMKSLTAQCLALCDVIPDNAEFYYEEFEKFGFDQENNNSLSLEQKDSLQEAICQGNDKAEKHLTKQNFIRKINHAIMNENEEKLMSYWESDEGCLPPIDAITSRLCFIELSRDRTNLNRDLEYSEIMNCVKVASALATLNLCVDSGNPDTVYDALLNQELGILNVDSECKLNYLTALREFKKKKYLDDQFLVGSDIQECVLVVNSLAQEESDRIHAIQRTNHALKQSNPFITLNELCQPVLNLTNVNRGNVELYHHLLTVELTTKSFMANDDDDDDEIVLWLDEIQAIIDEANELEIRSLNCCKLLAQIYHSYTLDDLELFGNTISNSDAGFTSVIESCMDKYFANVKDLINTTADNDELNKWALYKVSDQLAYFYDLSSQQGHWKLYDVGVESLVCLTKEMIQDVISQVTGQYDLELLKNAMEPRIVGLQAYIRGGLTRQAYQIRLHYLRSQELQVLKIQAWWRGCKQRKLYLERINFWKSNVDLIIKVQSYVRMFLARSRYIRRLTYLKSQVSAIVKIQTCWRANKTRKAFKELMTSPKPSFITVQMFVHLLDFKNTDFSEELNLHQLQSEVVKTIRNNQHLEQDLSTMDIKIGLLVKNRITLQDVIAHGRKLNKKPKDDAESSHYASGVQGFKSFNKEAQTKMEAYQHFFYLLQSEPRYLSRLIFLMLPNKTTKFIESIVLTTFNYASNQREEYLLLKLFRTALNEEIRCKVDKPGDIVTGNSLIIKMIVGFHRNKRGQSALRDMLGPLVKQVLEDKNLRINTNPVEVYKLWVNQLESQTGQASGLPYNVDQEEALKHDDVVDQLQASVESLKVVTLSFFNAILNSLDKIPYGMLYMAKVLKSSLESKFPEASGKDILKVVGNLLYYRYINPAIVAPDGFSIVDVGGGENLSQEQRRNLGSVAKLLQFATSKSGFGAESPHLVCLNPFIIDCHEKFKQFFEAACEVEELETYFKVDEYTESTFLTKPTIFISLQEIREMHLLLLENESLIAPDPDDVLHDHLEDLGDKPDLDSSSENHEICLTLTNKFKIQESKRNETNQLHVMTKQMIVDVMHCTDANSIPDMLKNEVNDTMNLKYCRLLEIRRQHNSGEDEFLNRIVSYDGSTLGEAIKKIRQNLNLLEDEGYFSSKDDFQEIINTIALDIRNRHQYRKRRRQDIMHMKTTLNNLKSKTAFFVEQVEYYNVYIKQCLKNMGPGKKMKVTKKLKTFKTLKYTGSKLHEKGVITEIEGLTKNQFKNVLFEISPTDTDGSFIVKVKYMGTNLADIKLEIQSLLECQYEGVSVMKMFDRAQVNVNLLLFLLNTKFYGQAK